MILTAREAMQALLDGKALCDNNNRCWRMDDNGRLQTKWKNNEKWIEADTIWNDSCRIWEEHPLTFEQALRAMLDGKVVKCESHLNSHRFHDGEFQFMNNRGKWSQVNWFDNEIQKGKWKVVE